ncbi:MAG: acetolactate synthase 2 small subunit [Chromatiales bacterium]|nr:acetolactate synthase 2 small subunit [Chromatiales bacterium]
MIYSMHIEANDNPAMLERILQTTRVRGFHIRHLDVRGHESKESLRITMTVESSRDQNRLITQLHKISGIMELTALHSINGDNAEPASATA